ncbi:MAG TPA: aconitase X, partial [Rhodopila sp.]
MRLNEEAEAMLRGEMGAARQWAVQHQIRVGTYLGARDLVPVRQAHIMADTESLGEAGVALLERLAALPRADRCVRIPTITDPRGTDFGAAARLKQQDWMVALERRTSDAFEALGVLMTNTCINYQTIMPPVRGEHMAYGDTGVAIYCNAVLGARSNFEGGPSALAAGLTGFTPRYGYHLDECRLGSLLIGTTWTPGALHEWGALGGVVGRLAGDYWRVPIIAGFDRTPGSDELKHFGAAMASFGSVAMFHIPGVTPEAAEALDGKPLAPIKVGRNEVTALLAEYADGGDEVDVVVFSAPQLSLLEMQMLADRLDHRRVAVPLLAVTSP